MGRTAIMGAIAVIVVLGGATLWQLGRAPHEQAPPAAPKTPISRDARDAAVEAARRVVDVEGLPPLFPEGRDDHPVNPISIADYFVKYGATTAIDVETKQFKPEVSAAIEQELVGKRVDWEGYVSRIRSLPSGRVTLVIAPRPDAPPLDVAMIKFAAGLSEQIHAFEKGDRVRVVAVYDKLEAVFPSLRGLEVVRVERAGLTSGS